MKQFTIRNRICVPPLVIQSWGDSSGRVGEKNIAHYRALTQGGAGLVIQEATAVLPTGRIAPDQLGIWEDGHIEGLRRLAEVFHAADMPAILQLSHAGILAADPACRVAPSEYRCVQEGEELVGRALTVHEIVQIEQAFIEGARRAAEAGFDGVEIHGSHGYLISEFLNSRINRRTDAYNVSDRLFVKNILSGIRAVTPPDFILGFRLGAFEPTLQDGITYAKWLEAQGVDFINGFVGCDWEAELELPAGYPFDVSVYGAEMLKKAVSIPVFAVRNIRTGEQAERILTETGVDGVMIGRCSLVNYDWGNDVRAGRNPGGCLGCAKCMWQRKPELCPGRKAYEEKIELR
ncbi:MAG: NADH:flavin oxidoreductase [Butyricicoccus sp.]|nr:NADH:flavin oxidoreductase [Butyricicoccus sp.]